MKIKNGYYFILPALLIVVVLWMWWSVSRLPLPDASMTAMGSETIHARVVKVLEDGEIDLGGVVQRYQIVQVELLEGEYQGVFAEIDYGRRQVLSSAVYMQPDDEILVTIGSRPDGTLTVYFADFVRTDSMLWLALVFIAVILLISR